MSRNQTTKDVAQPAEASQARGKGMHVNSQAPMNRLAGRPTDSRNPVDESTERARTISSEELFRGARELTIEHAGAHYRLKITRQGKLILNK